MDVNILRWTISIVWLMRSAHNQVTLGSNPRLSTFRQVCRPRPGQLSFWYQPANQCLQQRGPMMHEMKRVRNITRGLRNVRGLVILSVHHTIGIV